MSHDQRAPRLPRQPAGTWPCVNLRSRTAGPATASVPDTLRAVAGVLLPLVARGVIVRRQRVVAPARVPIRRDRPLPGTLDPFHLRFTLTPIPR